MLYVIAVMVFLTVVLAIEALFMIWRDSSMEKRRKINRRIRTLSAGGAHGKEAFNILRRREYSSIGFMDRVLTALPRVQLLDRQLQQTGTDVSVMQYLLMQLLVFLLFFIAFLLFTFMPLWAAMVASLILGFLIPSVIIKQLGKKRRDKLVEQLPQALDYIARSLRAGNPFSASVKAISKQMKDPIAGEFEATFDEINYGVSVDEALYNLGHRTGVEEMRFFITSVVIQRQTGGNLAEILQRLAVMMRRRARTYRDIQTQAAEMKLSALILTLLPFVVAGAILVFNPNYLLSLAREPYGVFVFAGQGALMLIGYLVMRRMINFRV